jgi:hypothetical protein
MNKVSPTWEVFFNDLTNTVSTLRPVSGPTSDRPKTNIVVGAIYFDTTLGRPVFFRGWSETKTAMWVNADGTKA